MQRWPQSLSGCHMAEQDFSSDDLSPLLAALCDGSISDADFARVQHWLATDPRARRWYVAYMDLHGELCWDHVVSESGVNSLGNALPCLTDGAASDSAHVGDPSSALPPTILVRDMAPLSPSGLPSFVGYFSQVGPLSYLVSAILMCVAALGAWQYKVADRREVVVHEPSAAPHEPNPSFVGRVTAMDGCRWPDELTTGGAKRTSPRESLVIASRVSLGRKVNLDSGLLEITYDSGASVIVQGPAAFEVGSNGGFLSMGRVTGKLEKTASHSNPQSPISTPFAIRTPTAIVTDLGTKFGIEVDRHGRTTSYVFRGSVRVHPTSAADDRQDCVLRAKESAQVEAGDSHGGMVRRIDVDPGRFVRNMDNRRIPVNVFGTGTDVERSNYDRHWRVVAMSSVPHFQPEPARLAGTVSSWTVNGAGRAQWITTLIDPARTLSVGDTWTFRTTFELDDVLPETAVMDGWFLTNGHVDAIRINGQQVRVPEHGATACELFQKFTVDHGFVEGANALELDVAKVDYPNPRGLYNPMISVCVDLEGQVQER